MSFNSLLSELGPFFANVTDIQWIIASISLCVLCVCFCGLLRYSLHRYRRRRRLAHEYFEILIDHRISLSVSNISVNTRPGNHHDHNPHNDQQFRLSNKSPLLVSQPFHREYASLGNIMDSSDSDEKETPGNAKDKDRTHAERSSTHNRDRVNSDAILLQIPSDRKNRKNNAGTTANKMERAHSLNSGLGALHSSNTVRLASRELLIDSQQESIVPSRDALIKYPFFSTPLSNDTFRDFYRRLCDMGFDDKAEAAIVCTKAESIESAVNFILNNTAIVEWHRFVQRNSDTRSNNDAICDQCGERFDKHLLNEHGKKIVIYNTMQDYREFVLRDRMNAHDDNDNDNDNDTAHTNLAWNRLHPNISFSHSRDSDILENEFKYDLEANFGGGVGGDSAGNTPRPPMDIDIDTDRGLDREQRNSAHNYQRNAGLGFSVGYLDTYAQMRNELRLSMHDGNHNHNHNGNGTETERKAVAADVKLERCLVCFDDKAESEFFHAACGHNYCLECLEMHYKIKTKDGDVLKISCIEPQCDREIAEDEILKNIKDPAVRFKFVKFKKQKLIMLNPNARFCCRPDCEGYMVGNRWIKLKQKLQCPKCLHYICFDCSQPWHGYFISCGAKVDFGYSLWALNKDVQKCPKCRVRIEKGEGCNHMTCRSCKYQFCWICRGHYTYSHYEWYNIFGCPGAQNTPKFCRCPACFPRCCNRILIILIFLILVAPILLVLSIFFGIGWLLSECCKCLCGWC